MSGLPEIRRERVVWAVLGLAVTAVVAYVVYAFVGAIVTGLFLYYATRPVERHLTRRFGHPGVGAAVSLLAVGVPFLLVLAYAGLVGARELNQLAQTYQIEQLQAAVQPYVGDSPVPRPGEIVGFVRDNAGSLLASLGAAALWAGRFFVALVVAYYLLKDDDGVSAWFRGSLGEDHDAVRFLEGVDDDLDTVYTGNLLTVAITAVIAAATFYAFDFLAPGDPTIQFPLLLGLLVGVFTLFPVVGMKAVWVPYAAYLFVRSLATDAFPLWVPVAFVVVAAFVVDFLPDIFVRSYLSKGGLNMGLMLLAYTLGVIVFGWYGLFLGPLVLIVFVHFAERVFPNVVDPGRTRLVDD